MGRQQQDFAGADRHAADGAILVHHQHHVALELIEKFLHRVVVEVGALVGTADDGDHHIGVLPDLNVTDRRLEQMAVFIDPGAKIERL